MIRHEHEAEQGTCLPQALLLERALQIVVRLHLALVPFHAGVRLRRPRPRGLVMLPSQLQLVKPARTGTLRYGLQSERKRCANRMPNIPRGCRSIWLGRW